MGSVCARVRLIPAIAVMAFAGLAHGQTVSVVRRAPPPAATADQAAAVERPLAGTPMPWAKSGPARVVWTGFQMNGEASRVYLQATADVELSVAASKDGLTVTVHNSRLQVRNGRRPMDTRFFRTPVRSVSLGQHNKDVTLHIALGQPVGDVVPRKEPGPSGSQFWVLDFPPAKEILADGRAAAGPP